jgi:hypothetical protein
VTDRSIAPAGDHPTVTVLVPAYKPDERLLSTLESLRAQTYPETRILLSMDHVRGHRPPRLPEMSNLTTIAQPSRLGWVAHVNTLVRQVRTPLFMVLAHDDRVTPRYIERCVNLLSRAPEASVAHGAVGHFGVRGGEVATTSSIRGSPFARVMEFIRRRPHQAELGWRGVARSTALRAGLRLRTRRSDGMFSNTLWALELLVHGESRVCETEYYEKHTAPDGLSRLYHRRSVEERSAMLADNVACLVDVVQAAGFTAEEQEQVVTAYVEWLLALQGNWNVVSDERNSDRPPYAEVRPHIARFVAGTVVAATAPPLLQVPVPGDGVAGSTQDERTIGHGNDGARTSTSLPASGTRSRGARWIRRQRSKWRSRLHRGEGDRRAASPGER